MLSFYSYLLIFLQLTVISCFQLKQDADCLGSAQSSPFCKGALSALTKLAQSGSSHSSWQSTQPSLNQTYPKPSLLNEQLLERYKVLARLQYISYCENHVETWTCGICQDEPSTIKNTSNVSQFVSMTRFGITGVGLVGASHDLKRVFVVIQGALHKMEWIRAYEAKLKTAKNLGIKEPIKVHSGFLRSYTEVRSQLVNQLLEKTRLYPHYKVVIMGHSYGGALASLLALDIAHGSLNIYFDPKKTELVTFGAPRVGNRAYAEAMNTAGWATLTRIVHTTDAFVHLPPRAPHLGLSYVHHRGEVWLNRKNMEWVQCDTLQNSTAPGESPLCANSVPLHDYSIEAHISYTTKRAFAFCPYDPLKKPIDIEYLPNYLT